MERLNCIWNHPEYQSCLGKIQEREAEREFCRHTPEHFLDVARLTYLLALEAGVPVEKELIYAAGLLHDIGRHLQYDSGISHEQASVQIAGGILKDCGFDEKERSEILRLIGSHRTQQDGNDLAALFYLADKLSRNCFTCPVQEACNWPKEKKNLKITY
jgi:putative nucleotidyltransferase with HDIG domain